MKPSHTARDAREATECARAIETRTPSSFGLRLALWSAEAYLPKPPVHELQLSTRLHIYGLVSMCRLLLFCNYVLVPTNGFLGYYPFLPWLYEANPKAGYFRNSVDVVVLVTFARVKNMNPLYFHRSRQSYRLAISQIRSVLNNTSEAYSLAPLAAVVLLWKYDVCNEQYYISLESR
jgi:hypothetical protein